MRHTRESGFADACPSFGKRLETLEGALQARASRPTVALATALPGQGDGPRERPVFKTPAVAGLELPRSAVIGPGPGPGPGLGRSGVIRAVAACSRGLPRRGAVGDAGTVRFPGVLAGFESGCADDSCKRRFARGFPAAGLGATGASS